MYFNTAAFTSAGTGSGNSGRTISCAPNQRNVDFSVIKRTPIREIMNLEFRAKLLNIFNFVNFSNPSGSLTSSTFGTIRSTEGNPRVVQFALKLAF